MSRIKSSAIYLGPSFRNLGIGLNQFHEDKLEG